MPGRSGTAMARRMRSVSSGARGGRPPEVYPDEEAEIELMLWEYDRDGRIAIDNFFRREPELSLRMAGGIIPKRIHRDLTAFPQARRRWAPRESQGAF